MKECIISCCGVECSACEYFPEACVGCSAIEGRVFWLEYVDSARHACPIYTCCVSERGLAHCGKCADFPCAQYTDLKNGDPTKTPEENEADRVRQYAMLCALK